MRRFAILLLGASLLVLPACGGKTDEGARAAGITPTDALAFVSLNLDPSIEQQRNLLSIARRFPGARDKVQGEFEEARDGFIGDLLEEVGLDFEHDVEPWLGNEVALAVLPAAADGPPLITALVETGDAGKARAALEKAEGSGEFGGAYRVVGDYMVISDQEGEVDDEAPLDLVEAQSKKDDGGLAESPAFTSVVDQLAGDRLVLGWVDVSELADVIQESGGIPPLAFAERFASAESVALDLHAESDAMVFQGVGRAPAGSKGETAELTRSLPATTLAALTFFDFGKGIVEGLRSVAGFGADLDPSALLESATGIDLEADVLSWMDGEVVFVAGAVPDGGTFPNFALVVEPSDRAKAEAGLAKVREGLARQGFQLEERQVAGSTAYVAPGELGPGIQPAMALFADRFVLASQVDYLEQLSEGVSPGLAGTDAYESVLEDDDEVTVQIVVLIDPIREAIEKVLLADDIEADEYERDAKPNVEPLSAFGIVARQEGDFGRITMKLTFD